MKNQLPEIKFETVKIEPTNRTMQFGKIAVCSKCGNALFNPRKATCCKGAKVMSLKQYVEEVRHEVFDETKWKWGMDKDIVAVKNIDLKAELASNPF